METQHLFVNHITIIDNLLIRTSVCRLLINKKKSYILTFYIFFNIKCKIDYALFKYVIYIYLSITYLSPVNT